MTCVDRALTAAAARREQYRASARRSSADNPMLAHAGGARGTLAFGSQLMDATEQYKHFTGWAYTAIVRIATRLAAAEVCLGRKGAAVGAESYRQPGRRIKAWQRNRMPRYARKDASEIEVLDSHWLLDAMEFPNNVMTTWGLFHVMACSLELTGKAFWWLVPGDGRTDMFPLPSNWMTPIHADDQLHVGWKVSPSGAMGRTFTLPTQEVVYFPLPDPADPLGTISPLQTQAPAIATDEQIQATQFRMVENGIWPGIMLHAGRLPGMVPGQPGHRPVLTPEQRKDLIEGVRALYEGAVNYNEPLVVDGMIENVTRITQTPQEMDFLNSGQQTKSRIMQALGVNPIIAGEIAGVNRAQAAVAEQLFLGQVVNPLGCLIGQSLTMYLRRLGEIDTVLWLEEERVNDPEQRLREWKVAAERDYVNADEYRAEILGLPPQEEEDKPPDDDGGESPPGDEPAPQEEGEGGSTGGGPPAEDEGKSVNPKNAKAVGGRVRTDLRATVEQLWTRQVEKQEADFATAMWRFFREQAAEVGRELRTVMDEAPTLFSAPNAADQIVDRVFRPRDWDARLRKAAMPVMFRGAVSGYMSAKSLWEARTRKALTPDESAWIQNWTLPEAVKGRITGWLSESFEQPYWEKINDTTRTAIRHGLDYGLKEGHSLWEITNGIQAVVGDADKKRAWRIARTEATGTLNAGQQIQTDELEEAGLKVVKTWVTMGDDLVRDTHIVLEGKQVDGAKGVFKVGGYATPYPGHFSLPASERANCRCSTYSDTVEAEQKPAATAEEAEASQAGMTETASGTAATLTASVLDDFAGQTPDIEWATSEAAVLRALQKLRGVSGGAVDDLRALSGAPTGANVRISSKGGLIHTEARGDFGHISAALGRDLDGRLVQTIHGMEIKQTGQGIGTQALARMVSAGRRMGVEAIKLDALRAPWANGYYTWPRLGFDAPLPKTWLDEFAARLPKGLKNAQRVSDLMRSKAGRKFWKENGRSILAEFDTAQGSLSSKVLEGYIAVKRKRGDKGFVADITMPVVWKAAANIKEAEEWAKAHGAPTLPRTVTAAAQATGDAVREWQRKAVASGGRSQNTLETMPTAEQIAKNWKSRFAGRDMDKMTTEDRLFVQNEINRALAESKTFADIHAKLPQKPTVFFRAKKNDDEWDIDARAQQNGPVTAIMRDSFWDHRAKHRAQDFKSGAMASVSSSEHGIAATYRHETGHTILRYCNTSDVREWSSMFNRHGKTLKKELSWYSGTNVDEAFAETFALFTDPRFKASEWPAKVQEAVFLAERITKTFLVAE